MVMIRLLRVPLSYSEKCIIYHILAHFFMVHISSCDDDTFVIMGDQGILLLHAASTANNNIILPLIMYIL